MEKLILNNYNKRNVFNYLENIPNTTNVSDIIEVQFKNTRKELFLNSEKLLLKKGNLVAVESQQGHDIGIVSLSGTLLREYIRINQPEILNNRQKLDALLKIYRKATNSDIEKWQKAIALEHTTLIKSREVLKDFNLNMKISDVEYQGDGSKAIFYFISDDRVDFRELVKNLAKAFRTRIEMKQIGSRQEACRIGGISSCGQEFCCTKWLKDLVSVYIDTAKFQTMSTNLQKLTGHCGKLKCCLNYEMNFYKEVQKSIPNTNAVLKTNEGEAYYKKTDVFRQIMWYSFDKHKLSNEIPVSIDRVREIIEKNKKGIIVPKLNEES